MERYRTWPVSSSTSDSRFSSRPFHKHQHAHHPKKRKQSTAIKSIPPPSSPPARFGDLPFDLLTKVAAALDAPDLRAASMVCRSWRQALQPLREAMVLYVWGKRFKHGRYAGMDIRPDRVRALESFLKAASRGSVAAMVDAGLLYWEMGKREKARDLYRKAAELGHPVGQCNLGISYLESDPPEQVEAVKWFYQAAMSGNARAQYNLALCLHKGRGVECNMHKAAKWYKQAAEGGNVRAMYNTSLCYFSGEGFPQNTLYAKRWMKLAADCGHKKAQYEHGLKIFLSGDWVRALVYLELATRAGNTAASHIKNVIFESLPQNSRDQVMSVVNTWKPSQYRCR
ncbi:F-box protein At1g70590 isoform X1 [Typha angustifolia]|uniref:F-box protein At1g70590 isoform X1 n=1 Tax=Typha angustifolia TaxID=59011 RepID=UPI003C2D6D73